MAGPGGFLEPHHGRLRVASAELPVRPGEPPELAQQHRAFTLSGPPGALTAATALAEACAVFDAAMAGNCQWPDPDAIPAAGEKRRLVPATLERLIEKLRQLVVGEQLSHSTWQRHYLPPLRRLMEVAGQQRWARIVSCWRPP